jgi:hypothetical protein
MTINAFATVDPLRPKNYPSNMMVEQFFLSFNKIDFDGRPGPDDPWGGLDAP